MEYVSLIITLLYALLVVRFIQGWIRLPYFSTTEKTNSVTRVSVIIPFKNELENLQPLLKCLKNQTYPVELSHFYFVNDKSTDGGDQWLLKQINDLPDFSLLHGEGKGKKNALALAYKVVKGELIITLDADCEVDKDWLKTIVHYYQKTNHQLIICPVKFTAVHTLWEKIQAVEFQSLIVSGAGAAANKEAIMCNGANLAFSASLVKHGSAFLNEKEASGDDMFLLEHVKNNTPDKISFLKSRAAMATTQAATFRQFFAQRSRWASKSRSYKDRQIIYAGIVVLLINLILAVGVPLSFVLAGCWKIVAFTFCTKFLVDVALLAASASFFDTKKALPLSFIIASLYPFYVLYSVFNGLFGKLRWKG